MHRCNCCKKAFPQNRRRVRFCPYCGAEQAKKKGGIVILLAAACLLIAAGGVLAMSLPRLPEVQNAEEAIAALREQGRECGYENAFSELTVQCTQKIGGDSYYRLQQNYEGFPVYGKSVTLVTDETGRQQAISENVLDIPEDVSLTPAITPTQAAESIGLYALQEWGVEDGAPTEAELERRNLYIWYAETDAEACLAYAIETGGCRYLVDTRDGTILECCPTVLAAEAEGVLADTGESIRAWQREDGRFQFADLDNAIYVCDARGETFVKHGVTTKLYYEAAQPVCSADSVFGDGDDDPENSEQALAMYRAVLDIRSYYHSVLGDHTIDGPMLLVCNDKCGKLNGKQALSYPLTFDEPDVELLPEYDVETQGSSVAGLSLGTYYSADPGECIDIIAHEYTHLVTGEIVGWTNENRQTAALNEAFSDIFGELAEADARGVRRPDWEIGRRTIYDPAENGYPAYVGDAYIVEDYVLSAMSDYSHAYSTVISHAAYLMWNGIDGDRQKMLSNEELAELWYRAMYMLPADAEFVDCRTAVTGAAECMSLTSSQRRCVSEAFERVLVSDRETEDGYTYLVGTKFSLSVCDAEEILYPGYTLVVREDKPAVAARPQADRRYTFAVTEAEALELRLAEGDYVFTVTDDADPARQMSFAVRVDPIKGGRKDEIVLVTDFGEPHLRCLVYEEQADGEDLVKVPVPNAELSFFSHRYGKVYRNADTGTFGEAATISLPAGTYTVWVDAEGYEETEQTVTLEQGDSRQLALCLQRTDALIPEDETEIEQEQPPAEEDSEQTPDSEDKPEDGQEKTEQEETEQEETGEQAAPWEPEQSAADPAEYEIAELVKIYQLEDGTKKRISCAYVVLKGDNPVFRELNQQFLREAEAFMREKTRNQSGTLQEYIPEGEVDEAVMRMCSVSHNENGIFSIASVIASGNAETLDIRMEMHGEVYDLNTGRELELSRLLNQDRSTLAQELREIVWEVIRNDEDLRADAEQILSRWDPEDHAYYIDEGQVILLFPEQYLWNRSMGVDEYIPTGRYLP